MAMQKCKQATHGDHVCRLRGRNRLRAMREACGTMLVSAIGAASSLELAQQHKGPRASGHGSFCQILLAQAQHPCSYCRMRTRCRMHAAAWCINAQAACLASSLSIINTSAASTPPPPRPIVHAPRLTQPSPLEHPSRMQHAVL